MYMDMFAYPQRIRIENLYMEGNYIKADFAPIREVFLVTEGLDVPRSLASRQSIVMGEDDTGDTSPAAGTKFDHILLQRMRCISNDALALQIATSCPTQAPFISTFPHTLVQYTQKSRSLQPVQHRQRHVQR